MSRQEQAPQVPETTKEFQERSADASRRGILGNPAFRRVAGFTVGTAVVASALAGCKPGEVEASPSPSLTETSQPYESPTPNVSESPSPSPEVVEITPEMQQKMENMDLMPSAEFGQLPIEKRLQYQSWLYSKMNVQKFMNKWAESNGSPAEAYPGEPSASNTAEQATALMRLPFLVSLFNERDTDVWGGATDWDRNKAEKIYATSRTNGDPSMIDNVFDAYEAEGEFKYLLGSAGTGMVPPLVVTDSQSFTDAEGRPCYDVLTDQSSTRMNICLYPYTDYTGAENNAWVRVD